MPQTSSPLATPRTDGGEVVASAGGPECRVSSKQRSPVFDIPREEVMRRCREAPFCQICGAEALVLRDLMEFFGWSIDRLSDCSGFPGP